MSKIQFEDTPENNAAAKAIHAIQATIRKKGGFGQGTRDNERGNVILDWSLCMADESRYLFDEILHRADGWRQYDTHQDAHYFGVWVNPRLRLTCTYAEGDVCIVQCPSPESFKAELADMARCYGDPPPAFTVIDLDKGVVTEIYDTRPTE